MPNVKFRLVFAVYALILVFLAAYSFTQVDLNLTLSQVSVFQSLEKSFQYIGYFQRPLSTAIYLAILVFLFVFYFLILRQAAKNKISKKQIWWLSLLSVGVLVFSYPAFSHDVFNYVFDARIFTKYHLNPYLFKALDFPADPWTRFMHWTHRNYPYGPTWITLSIPFSYLGFEKFILTVLNFKVLVASAYLGTIYLIGKLTERINPGREVLGMVFFAFNPLVIIESLVGVHHDIIMMFFILLSFYLLYLGKRFLSFLSLIFSIGIKFATLPLLPLWLFGYRKNLAVVLGALSFIYIGTQRDLQPWYFLWVLPLVALAVSNRLFAFMAIALSLGLLLHYAPFLYFGNWDDPVPQIRLWVTVTPAAIALLVFIGLKLKERA